MQYKTAMTKKEDSLKQQYSHKRGEYILNK